MPLTKEQLLQKRFKFISPYPGGHWEIGEVFEICGKNCYATDGMYMIIMHGSILEAYPHIFQPLSWWSDRKTEDLPKYVKWLVGPRVKEVQSAEFDFTTDTLYLNGFQSTLSMWIDALEPCDENEYLAYINQKQQ